MKAPGLERHVARELEQGVSKDVHDVVRGEITRRPGSALPDDTHFWILRDQSIRRDNVRPSSAAVAMMNRSQGSLWMRGSAVLARQIEAETSTTCRW